jgi:hypothetical protein
MANTSELPAHKRTKDIPSIREKDQYHSLLNYSDSESNIETTNTDSRRLKLRSVTSYFSVTLFFVVSIIVVVELSISLIQLRSILSQLQDQLSVQSPGLVVPTSLISTSNVVVNTSRPTGIEFGHCGHSIKEARALGCVFDPMSFAWQRPECYNTELVNDFLSAYDWHFFPNAEPSPHEEFPREEWMRGDHLGVFGAWAWHMYHCSYSWRKFHIALTEGRPLDSDVLDPEHTTHCSTEILLRDTDPKLHAPCEEDPESCQVTMIWTRFNKCGYF